MRYSIIVTIASAMIPAKLQVLTAFLLGAFTFLFLAASSSAETFYDGVATSSSQILYVDPAGSDSNSGQSPAEAFATIQKGIDTIDPGGKVKISRKAYKQLRRGQKSGKLTLSVSGEGTKGERKRTFRVGLLR